MRSKTWTLMQMGGKSYRLAYLGLGLALLGLLHPVDLFCAGDSIPGWAQELSIQELPTATQSELASDEDLHYQLGRQEEPGFWQRIKGSIAQWLSQYFRGAHWEYLPEVLFTLAIVLVLFGLIKLFGLRTTGGITRGEKSISLEGELSSQNLQKVDWEDELQKAQKQGDWRRLIRVHYLYVLQLLTSSKLIAYEPGKTNYHYLQELQSERQRSPFQQLSHVFEHVWYGGFTASPSLADECHRALSQIRESLP